MTAWDIGANVGLYSLAGAKAVGSSGRVCAFEPIPRNLEYLRRHTELNGLTNVDVVPAAVSDASGTVRMSEGQTPCECHMDAEGQFEVPAISLDSWQRETGAPLPGVIKIDVEGAETQVLRGASQTICHSRPVIFLALHGEQQRHDCATLLTEWGYEIQPAGDGLRVEDSSEWLAEPI
jgi:FkbM family methyltransferase